MKYRITLILLFCFFIVNVSYGQSNKKKGDDFYFANQYKEALDNYLRIDSLSMDTELLLKIAYSYFRANDLLNSREYYEKAKNKQWPFEYKYMLDYGNVLRELELYEDAKAVFKLMQKIPLDLVNSCNWVQTNNIKTSDFEIREIETPSQTTYNGFYKRGDSILIPLNNKFVWYNIENKNTNSFVDKFWEYNLNSPNLIGDTIIVYSGNSTKNIFYNKKYKSEISNEGENKLAIWSLDIRGVKHKPERIFLDVNNGYTHPYFDSISNRLYFVSDRLGGYGGFDIYYSEKRGDNWSDPVNVGEKVNTPYDEAYPSVYNNIIFYASKGHLGFGGYDIFMKDLSDDLSESLNMQKPINSSNDDFYYREDDSQTGYIISNRDIKSNRDILYKFVRSKIKESNIESSGIVNDIFIDESSLRIENGMDGNPIKIDNDILKSKIIKLSNYSAPLGINIIGISKPSSNPRIPNSILAIPNNVDVVSSDDNHILTFTNPKNSKEISFEYNTDHAVATITRYIIESMIPLVVEIDSVRGTKDAYWTKKEEEKIMLPYLYFDTNSEGLIYSTQKDIDKLVKFMVDNEEFNIEFYGYADSRGTKKHNKILSKKRAYSVSQFMKEKGILSERIKFYGEGVHKDSIKDSLINSEHRVVNFVFVNNSEE